MGGKGVKGFEGLKTISRKERVKTGRSRRERWREYVSKHPGYVDRMTVIFETETDAD